MCIVTEKICRPNGMKREGNLIRSYFRIKMAGKKHTKKDVRLKPKQKIAVLEYVKIHKDLLFGKINKA